MRYFLIISVALTTSMLWGAAEEKKELIGLLQQIDHTSYNAFADELKELIKLGKWQEFEDRLDVKKLSHTQFEDIEHCCQYVKGYGYSGGEVLLQRLAQLKDATWKLKPVDLGGMYAFELQRLDGFLDPVPVSTMQEITAEQPHAVRDMTTCAMTTELEDRVRLTFNKKKNRQTALLSELKQHITAGNGANLLERESDLKQLNYNSLEDLQSHCRAYGAAMTCVQGLRAHKHIECQFDRINARIIAKQKEMADKPCDEWTIEPSMPMLDTILQQERMALATASHEDSSTILRAIDLFNCTRGNAMEQLAAIRGMIAQWQDQSPMAVATYASKQIGSVERLRAHLEKIKSATWVTKQEEIGSRYAFERHKRPRVFLDDDCEDGPMELPSPRKLRKIERVEDGVLE